MYTPPMVLLLFACTGLPEPLPDTTDTDSGLDTDTDTDSGADACAVDADAAEWMAWDDGTQAYTLKDLKGNRDGYVEPYNLYTDPGWEAVRFELAHDAHISALKLRWADSPEEGEEHRVGVYADFGHNGFDFVHDPALQLTVCPGQTDDEGWTTYALDLDVDGPALVYAASWHASKDGPFVALDAGTVAGTCGTWDDCHSALAYPENDEAYLYAGLSFPLQFDYLARLQYAYTSDVADEDLYFHVDPALSTGGNVAWGDYDDDGDDDLMAGGPTLYRNDGGVFTDVTSASGASVGVGTSGGVWGDYDNDGCLDYYGIGGGTSGGELLLRSNCDGTFTDGTALSGIDDLQSDRSCLGSGEPEQSVTAGATWTDFDNDGLLDLVQANFLCFDSYTNYPDRFWHNEGGGVFAEWGEEHGFEWDDNAGRGAATIDADLDGDLDVAIISYVLQPDLFYRNDGGGRFAEVATDLGLDGTPRTFQTYEYYGHGIGLAWGDLDEDGDWDAVYGNLAHPRFYHFSDRTNLLIGEGGTWTNEADARGIVYHETHSNPSLLDIENDGDLDLAITEVYDGRPTDLYINDGAGVFTQVLEESGVTQEGGWGSAVADYDRDGDQDLLAYGLFRNDVAEGHWVQLRLVGDVDSNRAAIGAIAWVHADGRTFMRSVSGGNGTGCQDSQTLHVGLGSIDAIEAVDVWFPGGGTVTYPGVGVDAGWRLAESGAITPL